MSPSPHRLVAGRVRHVSRRAVGLSGVLARVDRRGRWVRPPGDAALPGFTWDDVDRASPRWYPQGITAAPDGRPVLLTSWYARGFMRWWHGARISVIDLSDEGGPRYGHVRLVRPVRGLGLRWPAWIHAGGLAWYGPHLFVACGRDGLRVFRVDDMRRGWLGGFVLPELVAWASANDEGSVPFTYSFVSVERGSDGDRLVAGEYGRAGGSHRLVRYALDPSTHLPVAGDDGVSVPLELHEDQAPRMQGATVVDGTWFVTASSGEDNPGDLWTGTPGALVRHRGVLPTGPEDIAFEPGDRRLWTLTEWPGRRWVFPLDV